MCTKKKVMPFLAFEKRVVTGEVNVICPKKIEVQLKKID
jgi:hypothetical protein